MTDLLTTIGTSVLLMVFSALLTYFFTKQQQYKSVKDVISESLRHHTAEDHRESVMDTISKYCASCSTHSELGRLTRAVEQVTDDTKKLSAGMIFLITRQGGNPQDFNLI
jgi:hypothetical protein